MDRDRRVGSEVPSTPKPSLESSSAKAILGLAIPALGALVIEPLLLAIDSMMIGSLGTAPLAGLALASTVLTTLVGVFVFLAYATTALTARALGAGDQRAGIKAGIDAMWLALFIGLLVFVFLVLTASPIVTWMGADSLVHAQAVSYLRGAAFGMVPMLVILAATGTLRGLLDMRSPLYVLAAGSVVNVGANVIFIFVLKLGILGAGIALSITQTLMCLTLVTIILKRSKPLGVPLAPSFQGLNGAFGAGLPLLIRTLSLRVALLATVAIATQAGMLALAGHQVVNTVWTLAAFMLDALAIAAQSLIAVTLGKGEFSTMRALVRRLSWWGIGVATMLGALITLTSPWLPLAFGSDDQMHAIATRALLVAGILLPVGGIVFILDGILIGASQGRYLAWTGLVTLGLYLPALGLLRRQIEQATELHGALDPAQQGVALMWLWIAFAGWFMLCRALTNGWRAYSARLWTTSAPAQHVEVAESV